MCSVMVWGCFMASGGSSCYKSGDKLLDLGENYFFRYSQVAFV